MNSAILRLDSSDFIKGATTAVFTAVIVMLAGVATAPDFNVFAVNWAILLQQSVSIGIAAFVGYIGKNLVSDQNGAVLGSFGGSKKSY